MTARLASALILLASACSRGPAPPHTTLAGDLTPLREAFTADSGKVRAIFLASPT
jgi:hypothetical protein